MACVGSDQDRSGLPGISQERLETFFTAARLYSQWWEQAKNDANILPFGDDTVAAAAVFARIRTKVDDYFIRCGLAAFDAKAEAPLNPSLITYEALASQDLTAAKVEVERFPLAHIEAGRPLPLREGINPAWAEAMASFTELIVVPLFGHIADLAGRPVAANQGKLYPVRNLAKQSKAGARWKVSALTGSRQFSRVRAKTQLEDLIRPGSAAGRAGRCHRQGGAARPLQPGSLPVVE